MLDPRARRVLGRTLSRLSSASVKESIDYGSEETGTGEGSSRIGFTGAPGAGKSTLISRVAKLRLAACRSLGGIAILAIDPTSPLSGGAILGDRIRMDSVANEPDLYIRSISSRSSSDGLADNVADLISAVESYGFHEVLLETVGVGQAEYAIRDLVDTMVMVLQPNSGDAVQAMKAGVLELADIYVVNKADLPGAKKTASEIRGIVGRIARSQGQWVPAVIEVSQDSPEGLETLDMTVSEHLDWLKNHRDHAATHRMRRRYHLQSLIIRRVGELLDQQPELLDQGSLQDLYRGSIEALASDMDWK
ncbi:hypothetical protein MIH18_23285 (plasmid) [Marinobacter sp. M3C]|jgi:LAO/AO transport system kinase|uniref:ArgK/MeaB family GTPase n=1 Tax=Marinobacter sp. M3C TaxID=2917715 RepID=UPI00200BE761|nr:hypothetical protein [Marinobacter sp. M3C]UQG62645.1 hypothetical protein MIH18_23285 [Marinobacter sp. M3C]